MGEAPTRSEGPPRRAVTAWWLWAALGALSIVAGVIVLARPAHSLATLAVVAGIFILAESVFELARAVDQASGDRAPGGLIAVVGIAAGILLVRHPIAGVTGVALLIGIWLVVIGAVRAAWALAVDRRASTWVLAAVQVIAGIVVVAAPGIGFATLALLAGLAFIANGLALVGLAWALRVLPGEETPASSVHGLPA
jgi:uncharacterized membrane protein HdeD (DUF308 family)